MVNQLQTIHACGALRCALNYGVSDIAMNHLCRLHVRVLSCN